MSRTLFVWDADSTSHKRRTFYRKLSGYETGEHSYKGLLANLPEKSWMWVNESTILIEDEHAGKLRALLVNFSEILNWHEFKVKEKL